MRREPIVRLIDVCPAYSAALDKFEADPTEENWTAVTKAAREFRTKVQLLEREPA